MNNFKISFKDLKFISNYINNLIPKLADVFRKYEYSDNCDSESVMCRVNFIDIDNHYIILRHF